MRSGDPFYDATVAAVFDEAPAAMIVIDRSGIVRMWNRAAEVLTGWRADEVIGREPPYVPPEHIEAFRARHAAAFEQGEVPEITARRLRKDGRAIEVAIARSCLHDREGRPCAVLGILTDVTEKRREEREQRRAEANLRTLVGRCPEAIVVHRLGQAVFVNPQAGRMLGYDPEELLGRPVLDLVHPDDRPVAAQRARDAAAGIEAPPLHERLVRRDGAVVNVEVAAIPIHFDGTPAVLALARDLTERTRLEAELRARDRLASVGRLAAAVGHEINNPLAYVMGSLELAARQLDAPAPNVALLRELVAAAREGTGRVRLIVRDLKTFSQREPEEPIPVDVSRVLDSAIAMAQHEIRHRARLVKRYGEEVPCVLGSEARLGQVFLNLLVNAAQAIPEGHVAENEILVSIEAQAGDVAIEVRDTGVGVPQEIRARLFEPFFTTKPAGRGTGLGLSVCHSIVMSMGGRIRLEDAPGGGTSVVVTLPATPAPRAAAESAAPVRTATATSRRRVLIVDDEPRIATTLASLLEQDEVLIASSGADALRRLAGGEVFDAILCDLMMPQMSGMELYERVRAQRPGMERRIVFMTGGAFTPLGAEFLQSHPNACLEKPFDARDLEAALEKTAGM